MRTLKEMSADMRHLQTDKANITRMIDNLLDAATAQHAPVQENQQLINVHTLEHVVVVSCDAIWNATKNAIVFQLVWCPYEHFGKPQQGYFSHAAPWDSADWTVVDKKDER